MAEKVEILSKAKPKKINQTSISIFLTRTKLGTDRKLKKIWISRAFLSQTYPQAAILSSNLGNCGGFLKISICHQLSPSQKYIYTWSLQIFLGVLKSYESESFISALYVARSDVLVPPWYPSFEKITFLISGSVFDWFLIGFGALWTEIEPMGVPKMVG